ncbi:prepilin-type N-terminal cleavage/methylation domain-containing protein [Piscinibacter sp. XHJ-5]|uniref:type IV pilus modification PilV family protein n=1 Tax=Piscinibacter sp. XHJ-5 TaxID=3037797 RepID=UPI002453707B|nr:prepilin-type N-terminal cleavage/methylation domain-containing protein [Piscinibacter sp. XHJ-5]
MDQACRRAQRGVSLIESLAAFVVLSLGMLGMARLQTHMEQDADLARQRSEAVRLAQQDMEQLRAFAAVSAASGVRSYADISPVQSAMAQAPGQASNTSYRLERRVLEEAGSALKTATVLVHWNDRTGQSQNVVLQSAIAGTPPALSGALPLNADQPPMHPVHGRSPRIPASARKLGDGRSLLEPVTGGATAFLLSDATGRITERCSRRAAEGGEVADVTPVLDPQACMHLDALLLSGWIRFSLAAPPTASGMDRPLPLSMSLALSDVGSGGTPECFTEPHERIVAYHCVIATSRPWSGRSAVVPQGWTVGTAAGAYKVCRYVADQDSSGAIDRNAEHPEHYSNVDVSLMQQNFLVIHGDQACPDSTVQHEP